MSRDADLGRGGSAVSHRKYEGSISGLCVHMKNHLKARYLTLNCPNAVLWACEWGKLMMIVFLQRQQQYVKECM